MKVPCVMLNTAFWDSAILTCNDLCIYFTLHADTSIRFRFICCWNCKTFKPLVVELKKKITKKKCTGLVNVGSNSSRKSNVNQYWLTKLET